ncbi:MAG: hypothetical protein ACKV19_03230 [Verrucomicrobiales bacterium]
MADATIVQQSGMTLGGSGLTFESVDFGDDRGVIPLSRLTPTRAIPTTNGGPGIIPELGFGDPEVEGLGGHRRISAEAGAAQTTALNTTGDADFGTIYQAGGVDELDKTLDLFFAQPITTTTKTDVLMVEHWWGGVNLNGATFSGIDMSGNLVGSVTVLGSGQDMGQSGNLPGFYYALDVDGNPGTVRGDSRAIDGPARAWGLNFDAGLQLKGVRLAWSNGGLQYLGKVWGVAVSSATDDLTGWRQQNFGTTENTGNAANTANPDGDGVMNLLEYAYGMNPNAPDRQLLPVPSYNGSTMVASFNSPAGVDDILYGAESSTNLINWSPLTDGGAGRLHTFVSPVSATGEIYMRLRVTVVP